MNAGRDVERLIATWLIEEAPTRAPDRVLDAARQTIDHTNQRRLAAWREPMIVSTSRLVAAAVVIAAVVLGAGLLGRSTAPAVAGPTTPLSSVPASSDPASPAPTGPTRESFIAAHDAICSAATAQAAPLKDTFGDLFDTSVAPARRATALASLETYLGQLRSYTALLSAVDAPPDLQADHLTNIVQNRDMAILVGRIATLIKAGDLTAAMAVDAATDPLSQQMVSFETRFGLKNCP